MFLLGMPLAMQAQEKVVPIKYGDMDQWVTRKIHESGIIGGNTKLLYELGPTKEIDGNVAYVNQGGSPWGNSNVIVIIMMIIDGIVGGMFMRELTLNKGVQYTKEELRRYEISQKCLFGGSIILFFLMMIIYL